MWQHDGHDARVADRRHADGEWMMKMMVLVVVV